MRLAELVCTFAVASDAGMGMPMDHGLRSAAAAVRLGEITKVGDADRADAFYVALLRYVGCTSDSHLAADVMGDEVALRGELYGVDFGSPTEMVRGVARAFGKGSGRLRAAAKTARTMAKMPALLGTAVSHCEVADRIAARMGLGDRLRGALLQTFERWDGRGWPKKLRGEAIAVPMRLAQAAEQIEIAHRSGGIDAVLALTRQRSGKVIDPGLVAALRDNVRDVCVVLDAPSPWRAALDAEPSAHKVADDALIDEVLLAMADFADPKCRFTRTHSRGVAALARDAARHLRLGNDVPRLLERAGWLHDAGRVAVSAAVWDKPGALSDAERERIRMHTYVGERILAPAETLAPIAEIATLAHERVDGKGYHRKLRGPACSSSARILAAADVYHALREARPHRAARSADEAAAELTASARAGSLCPDAVEAVLAAAGHARPTPPRPNGLTEREGEVLRLVARGLTNKEVATSLGISTRTAGHHIEHVFAKLGVTTRAGATMFAMQKGLLEWTRAL